VAIEDRVLKPRCRPARVQGYESFLVQDLVLAAGRHPFRRERWATPDGCTIVAPLPPGIEGHFGPDLRRFVLAQSHQVQVTVPRLVALLEAIGIEVFKRQVVRLLIGRQGRFLGEAREVCARVWPVPPGSRSTTPGRATRRRTGSARILATTALPGSARPARRAGFNFLELLRAGHGDYAINAEGARLYAQPGARRSG